MSQTTSKTPSRIPISSSTWFITGIGRGLGRNIAEVVMQHGGRVAGTVRNLAHADELKKQFPDQLWIGRTRFSLLPRFVY
jgi:NAD(P)-dependent dehydrogenase (short-subunit alcohol dehydrogenase family)